MVKCNFCGMETGILNSLKWGIVTWESPLGKYSFPNLCPECAIETHKQIMKIETKVIKIRKGVQ